jgi:hypothetical protein
VQFSNEAEARDQWKKSYTLTQPGVFELRDTNGLIQIETGNDDGLAFIAIRDHGTGIPEEERSKVTERFYRGKGSPPGGSGLGLAIARDLAEVGRLPERPPDGGRAWRLASRRPYWQENTTSASRGRSARSLISPRSPRPTGSTRPAWAWQTALWLRDLRDRGVLSLEWKLFSLELNSSERDAPFWEPPSATARPTSHCSWRTGREARGVRGLLRRVAPFATTNGWSSHPSWRTRRRSMRACPTWSAAVGTRLADAVREEYLAARELDVFGVPTLQLLPGEA